jgi:hypothetical protein
MDDREFRLSRRLHDSLHIGLTERTVDAPVVKSVVAALAFARSRSRRFAYERGAFRV